jgi:hypothetical protein
MVSELTVILGDFFIPARAPQTDPLPRLAALEGLLARAERLRLHQGWRAWLAGVYAPAGLAAQSPARIAARAWLAPQTGPDCYWFATPVHYLAGIDSVHLHPDGLLSLCPEEQDALVLDFNALFGDEQWRLHALGHRELLLRGPPLDASAADPGPWAGRDPYLGGAAGADARALRRLGSEIEMWLHAHPLNAQRRERGQLAVTGLWLWGSRGPDAAAAAAADSANDAPVAAADATAAASLPQLYGADLFSEALWRLAGQATHDLPEGFEAMRSSQRSRSVVIYPLLGAEGLTRRMQRLEQLWLGPSLRALRGRQLRSLLLVAGEHAHRLRWWQLARWWRARSPWWEAFA